MGIVGFKSHPLRSRKASQPVEALAFRRVFAVEILKSLDWVVAQTDNL